MTRPTPTQLRAFNEVASTGSFSRAARSLGISQPAITAQIKSLEEAFEVRLFERTSTGAELTPLGDRLFQRTAELRDTERDAAGILLSSRAMEVGELSIAAGAPGPAMRHVAHFRRRYPGVRIDISFGNWQDVVTAVRDRQVDLGILTEAPSGSTILRRPLLMQSLVALVPATHPLARCRVLKLADLQNQPLLFRSGRSQTQRELNAALRAHGLTLEPLFWLESREAVYEAAAQGLGIGFMFDAATRRSDDVVRVPIHEIPGEFPEYAFCLATRASTDVVRAFMESTAPDL